MLVCAWFEQAEAALRAYEALILGGVDAQQLSVIVDGALGSLAPLGSLFGEASATSEDARGGFRRVTGIGWVRGPLLSALAPTARARGDERADERADERRAAMARAGMPEREARLVESAVRQGGVVLAARVPEAGHHAVRQILARAGGRALGSE